jgi:hypothetical protein
MYQQHDNAVLVQDITTIALNLKLTTACWTNHHNTRARWKGEEIAHIIVLAVEQAIEVAEEERAAAAYHRTTVVRPRPPRRHQ